MSIVKHEKWLFHLSYGHLNFRSLQQMEMKKMIIGLPNIRVPKKVCETCLAEKQTRKFFKAHFHMTTRDCLGVVHSNICGPNEVPLLAGNMYFVTFVNEYSRMIWLYVIKMKSDALEVFMRFKAHAERECGRQFEILKTDGGGEYTSNALESHYQTYGITPEITAPYTPQHNGLAERRNQTILNMTRSMIKEKALPQILWDKAVSTTVYLLNRCPTKKLEGKVPFEAWTCTM